MFTFQLGVLGVFRGFVDVGVRVGVDTEVGIKQSYRVEVEDGILLATVFMRMGVNVDG